MANVTLEQLTGLLLEVKSDAADYQDDLIAGDLQDLPDLSDGLDADFERIGSTGDRNFTYYAEAFEDLASGEIIIVQTGPLPGNPGVWDPTWQQIANGTPETQDEIDAVNFAQKVAGDENPNATISHFTSWKKNRDGENPQNSGPRVEFTWK